MSWYNSGRLYSPMMGMGGGLAVFTENQAVVIEDYLFSGPPYYTGGPDGISGTGQLTFPPAGTKKDFHDTWDLDASSDYMPEADPSDEGFWDVDANGDIIPLDV
tara:strand:- start:34 stop:345 length:312 start_codon:yes stop_codon:yes gene_type:complete